MKSKLWLGVGAAVALIAAFVGGWALLNDEPEPDGMRSRSPATSTVPGASGDGQHRAAGDPSGSDPASGTAGAPPGAAGGSGREVPAGGPHTGQTGPETGTEPPRIPGRDYRTAAEGEPNSFLLEASDQQSDGRSMVISRVIIKGSGGYVALHSQHGEPWPLFAASKFLPEGEHRNVVIRWRRSLAVNMTVFPMLHVEDNGNTTFNFPEHDEAPKIEGAYLVFPVKLYVE